MPGSPRPAVSAGSPGSKKPFAVEQRWTHRPDSSAGPDQRRLSARALLLLQALHIRIGIVGKSICRVAGRQLEYRWDRAAVLRRTPEVDRAVGSLPDKAIRQSRPYARRAGPCTERTPMIRTEVFESGVTFSDFAIKKLCPGG
jgi:hypothetical protein